VVAADDGAKCEAVNKEQGEGEIVGLIFLVVLAAIVWLFVSEYFSRSKMSYAEEQKHSSALADVGIELGYHISNSAEAIFVPLNDGGLDIFVSKSSFDNIPFPDRDDFVLAVADNWCTNNDSPFIPVVRFRDIQSGDTLAQQHCYFRASPGTTGNYTGIVHNKTADLASGFEVQMTDISGGNGIKGCMQVEPPLYGTGPVVGSTSGSTFRFVFKGGVIIQFEGRRIGHTVAGTYLVTGNSAGPENGEFSLHHDSLRVNVPKSGDLTRCPL